MMEVICLYNCPYRTSSGYCGSTGGWEHCQYRKLHQPNTVVGYVPLTDESIKSKLTVDEYGLFREKITNMKSEFDYYFDGEGCYIITRNGEFFLSCCGTEAETQHIVELLRKDAANDVEIQHVGYSEEECGRDK